MGILAVACEPPEKSGRPISHWTARELADEVVKRGIVPSISATQVGRYLREAALQPFLHRYNWHRPHCALNRQPPMSRIPAVSNLLEHDT